MWAEHPEIAHRWAHEYPESNRNLPQYAQKSKGENMQQSHSTPEEVKEAHWKLLQRVLEPFRKASESVLKEVNVPHSEKPVAAGDEHVTAKRDALSGERREYNTAVSGENKKTPAVLSLFKLQGGRVDTDSTSPAQKMAEILAKQAAVIRLGRATSQRVQRQYDPRITNSSIDLQKMQQDSQRAAQARLFGATPLPMGMQQQPQPVATYPGMNSQPQPAQPQRPKFAEAALAGIKPLKPMNAQNAATNPIGIQGALDSETVTDANGNKRVVPKTQQRMTGNSGFSTPGMVQPIRRA
jgi:hypothetical protein